jgi:hypothetical protein
MWIAVRQRFGAFNNNIGVTKAQWEDAATKQLGIRQALQRTCYGASEAPNGFVVGSWGKNTQVRPPTDVDLFFPLPDQEFARFNTYSGNKQSALLQEVRQSLLETYPQTTMRADGQVVIIAFNTLTVEVVPVFRRPNSTQFIMPDTNGGGRWKTSDPRAENEMLDHADSVSNQNTRRMIKMLKTWKRECKVPLKSFEIEVITSVFMREYENRQYDYYWYDWYFRDFFAYLCRLNNLTLTLPGTGEIVELGDEWITKAISARDRALKACEFEYQDQVIEAGLEWQKIFGSNIPLTV